MVGTWQGNKGLDVAPEPYRNEQNPHYETITLEVARDATNAEEQTLETVQYNRIAETLTTPRIGL
ncbi:MAG: hypothetical protein ACI9HY_002617 [Planctomycetaceae bacterium]